MGGEKISLCMCVNKFMLREKERKREKREWCV